jgi:hypothetical protein
MEVSKCLLSKELDIDPFRSSASIEKQRIFATIYGGTQYADAMVAIHPGPGIDA